MAQALHDARELVRARTMLNHLHTAAAVSVPPTSTVTRAGSAATDEHTRLAIDAAGVGTWEFNPVTGERYLSERCRELFGLASDEDLSPDEFALAVHPEDREQWKAALARALEPGSSAEGQYRVEYRTNGTTVRWIAAAGRAFFENGRAVRVIGTVQDISEQKEAQREREIFLGALGHDLRSPLTTIMINSVLLKRRGGPTVAEPIGRIVASTKRMTLLIDSLIDFARSRSGELQIQRAPVDLLDVSREVLYEVGLPHPTHKIELSQFGDTRGEWDRDRVGQVVQNLAMNAIEHGDGAPIAVSVGEVRDAVQITVKNSGKPIPEEIRDRLFDPFHRGTGSGKGVGLGLYIVKEIVAAHGGTVDFTSDEEGTVFRVELPRSRAVGIQSAKTASHV